MSTMVSDLLLPIASITSTVIRLTQEIQQTVQGLETDPQQLTQMFKLIHQVDNNRSRHLSINQGPLRANGL